MKKSLFFLLCPFCVYAAYSSPYADQAPQSQFGIEVGTVLYRRSDTHQIPLVIQGDTTIVTSTQLTNSSKNVNGLEAFIYYNPLIEHQIGFRYVGLLHWKDTISKEKDFGDDSYTFPFYGAKEAFAGAYKVNDTIQTKFQEFDLSWTYHHIEDDFSEMLNFGIGGELSFIQLYDKFHSDFTDVTRYVSAVLDPGITATYDISARNTLIGPSLIFKFDSNLLKNFKWGLQAVGGIFWNHAHQKSEIYQGSTTEIEGHKNTYAWVGQFSVQARWEPIRYFFVYFGYDAIGLSRVALAMDQIRMTKDQASIVYHRGMLITGGSLGLGTSF